MATANNYEDLLKLVNTNASALGGMYKGFDTTYNNYANQLVNNGSFQAIENARQNMTDSTNRQYDNAAKNYYTQYRINQNKLPEQLSNLGVTGGASETAQLGLMNNYSTNLYGNEQNRANALNTGNMQYDQMVAENSQNIANQLASTYLSMAQQARENQLADDEIKRQAEALAYDRQHSEEALAYERALQRAQLSGDFSAMKAFGWTDAEIKKAAALMAGEVSGGSSGGGGGSRRSGGRSSGRSYSRYGSSNSIYDVGVSSDGGGSGNGKGSAAKAISGALKGVTGGSGKTTATDWTKKGYSKILTSNYKDLSEGGQLAKARNARSKLTVAKAKQTKGINTNKYTVDGTKKNVHGNHVSSKSNTISTTKSKNKYKSTKSAPKTKGKKQTK